MVNTASVFLAPSVWNNMPNELKLCINLNTFKHKIKKYFLYKIRQKDNDIYLHNQALVFTTTDAFFSLSFVCLFDFFFFFGILPYLSLATYFVK